MLDEIKLKGNRTYFAAIGLIIAAVAYHNHWIDDATYKMIEGILGGAGLAFLRVGVEGMKTNGEIPKSG